MQSKDVGGEAKLNDKEDGNPNAAAGIWRREVVTSPEPGDQSVPVLCAQRGLCPLRLLTSWGLWSRLSSSQEVFAKSKTIPRKRSVGSRGVASLYLMRSERT